MPDTLTKMEKELAFELGKREQQIVHLRGQLEHIKWILDQNWPKAETAKHVRSTIESGLKSSEKGN